MIPDYDDRERLTKTISWRVTASEYAHILPFFESFPGGSPTKAMRYLLNLPEVRAAMASRVAESRVPA